MEREKLKSSEDEKKLQQNGDGKKLTENMFVYFVCGWVRGSVE